MSNLLIALYASYSLTFSKLCAAKIFTFQWHTKNLQQEVVLFGPELHFKSPDITIQTK